MRNFSPNEAIAFVFIWVFGWAFFGLLARRMRDKGKLARLEMAHKERMTAMEKGIPLPELPDLEHHFGKERDIRQTLLLGGILCIFLGAGTILAFVLAPNQNLRDLWTVPLPLIFLGAGQLLYRYLTSDRTR